MTVLQLVLGDKRLSSWSLRPWLAMKVAGIPFTEIVLRLGQPDTAASIARYAPAGKVPALIDGPLVIGESTAIGEYLAERYPEARLWPIDPFTRAQARAVSHEMHAGFAVLRDRCPFAILHRRPRPADEPALRADIRRIEAIWTDCRRRSRAATGPFLFGEFSYADAMFAPVASRFVTYDLPLDSREATVYRDTMMALPEMKEWIAGAQREPETSRG